MLITIPSTEDAQLSFNRDIIELEPSMFFPSENDIAGVRTFEPGGTTVKIIYDNREYKFSFAKGDEPKSGETVSAFCIDSQIWVKLKLPEF